MLDEVTKIAWAREGSLTDSDDEDVVEAVFEAMAMTEGPSGEDGEDDEPRP